MQELFEIIEDVRIGALPRSELIKFIGYNICKHIGWISFGFTLGAILGIALRLR